MYVFILFYFILLNIKLDRENQVTANINFTKPYLHIYVNVFTVIETSFSILTCNTAVIYMHDARKRIKSQRHTFDYRNEIYDTKQKVHHKQVL